MLIAAIFIGLLAGLAVGGNIWNLASVRLRWVGVLLLAVIVRFGTEAAIGNGIELAEQLRLPLFGLAYAMLLAGLWANRAHPGMSLAFVGIFANLIAISLNGGRMPIWEPSLLAAGLTPEDARTVFHTLLPADLNAAFLLRAGPFADVIPIPVPFVRNVASVGDLFLAAGLAFFLFATVVRWPGEADEEERELLRRRAELLAGPAGVRRHRMTGGSSLASGLAESATLERPLIGGSQAAGLSTPSFAPQEALPEPLWESVEAVPVVAPAPSVVVQPAVAATLPAVVAEPAVGEPRRRHPYIRLALNGSFSALWAGQLISLFGDRVHHIALAFLVYFATGNSPIAVGAVFFAATLPNLLFSPIAGAFVDRWDQREVMVVSDILRAALVLLIPIAAATHLLLVYPLAFLITTVSIFFRPARVAVLPRIVRDDELLTANSALWIGETMADIVGYPLAGLFVAFLGNNLPLAFWIDAATYAASAALIWTIVVPPIQRAAVEATAGGSRLLDEMREGWRFLRTDRILLANTLQATIAQFSLGIVLALSAVYAADAIVGTPFGPQAVLGFLETGIGIGGLVGGVVVGLVGGRFPKGRMIILGYAACGGFIALLGVTNQLPIAVGLLAGAGLANMIFVIPSQTLFQQRTPPELLGRVASFRFSLVFGAMTIAMALGGVLAAQLGVAVVIGLFGLLTLVAGLAGMLVPAVRDA
ncbi:MAG: MFS transporter [Chloroflexota bacterium]|nr:MFS transporter [Chloroflexota bacterium]